MITNVIFLPALVSAIWPLVLLLLKPRPTRCQLLLSLTMMLEAFAMAMLGIFFGAQRGELFIYDYLFECTAMLCPAVYYVSICSLCEARGATLAQRRVFVVPLLFILGLTLAVFWLGPRRYEEMCHAIRAGEAAMIDGDAAWNTLYVWDHVLFPVVTVLTSFAVIVVASRKALLFQRRFNSFYADNMGAPKFSARELMFLTWLFAPIALASVFAIDFHPPFFKVWLTVSALALSVVQLLMGRFAFRLDRDARYLAHYITKKDRYGA